MKIQPELRDLRRPVAVVAAPMAGASTPELAAAVSGAGGLGFLAAGYKSADAMSAEVAGIRALTAEPFGINLFTPQADRSLDLATALDAYRVRLAPIASRYGIEPGEPTWDDDDFDAKIAHLLEDPVPVVTFTFGPVEAEVVAALHGAGSLVGFTVTSVREAQLASALRADFVVAQGHEAGGHRGTWDAAEIPNDDDAATVTRAVIAATGLPVVAAGGVSGPAAVRDLLAAGAVSVAVGTLFLAADESASPDVHKEALTDGRFTRAAHTRAFSGRVARALVNDFVRDLDDVVPSAYPNVHRMTTGIRKAAAAKGDPEAMALWAGAGHAEAHRRPAREILAALTR